MPIRLLAGITLVAFTFVIGMPDRTPAVHADVLDGVLYESDSSLNWSGYAATGAEFTAVRGSWNVPHVEASGDRAAYAAWVGIGGIITSDLIQAGTAALEDESGAIEYFAWFETLPAAAIPLPLEVRPGDRVSVEVREDAPTFWYISIRNDTTEEELVLPLRYDSSRSSAEWVQERPMIGDEEYTRLSDFEPITFDEGFAVRDGKEVSIAEAGARRINMANGLGHPLAVPTVLDEDGVRFSVSRTSADPLLIEEPVAPAGRWVIISIGSFEAALPAYAFRISWPHVDLLPHV